MESIKKLSEYVGKLIAVMFAPEDLSLVKVDHSIADALWIWRWTVIPNLLISI